MDLTIVRHSISTDNHGGLVSGAGSNVDLSAEGVAYAEAVSQAYDWQQFDQIFCSPMVRAKHTAKILVGDEAPIKYDERLSEMNFGDWEGVSEELIHAQHPEVFDHMGMFNDKYSDYAPNSESYRDLVARVTAFLDDLKTNYADQSILVICHGMTTRAFFASLFEQDIAKFGTISNVSLNQIYLHADDHFSPRLDCYNQKLV
jgi:alpha-ribazole phosphatase